MTQLQKVASLVAQARKDNQKEAIDKVAALVAEMRQEQEGLQKVAAKPLFGAGRNKKQSLAAKKSVAQAQAKARQNALVLRQRGQVVPARGKAGATPNLPVPRQRGQAAPRDIIDLVPTGNGRYISRGSSNLPAKPNKMNIEVDGTIPPRKGMVDVGGSSTVGSNQGGNQGGGSQGAQGGVPPAGKRSTMNRAKQLGALGGSYGVGLGTGLAIGAAGDDKAAPAAGAPASPAPSAKPAASASSPSKPAPGKDQSSFWDSGTNWIKLNPWTAVGGASILAILLSLLARGR